MESKTHLIKTTQLSHHPHQPSATDRHQTTAIPLLILLTLLTITAITYISTANKPQLSTNEPTDPTLLFNTSLHISITQLKTIYSLPQTLITDSTDPRTVSALHDCELLFDDALTQLNKSINSLTMDPAGDKYVFTRAKIRELNVWISAAMTDQDTCVDGLEEMGSTMCDEVRMQVQMSKQCMSDSLAILAKIQAVGLMMMSRFMQ